MSWGSVITFKSEMYYIKGDLKGFGLRVHLHDDEDLMLKLLP